jgi:hypothetical protein
MGPPHSIRPREVLKGHAPVLRRCSVGSLGETEGELVLCPRGRHPGSLTLRPLGRSFLKGGGA